jgi:anti-anti-sigma factor
MADGPTPADTPGRSADVVRSGRLSVVSSNTDGTTVVSVVGELDLATAPVVRDVLHDALLDGKGDVVVDLRQLEFADAAGIHVLLDIADAFAAASRQVTYRGAHGIAARALTLLELADRFGLGEGDSRELPGALDLPAPQQPGASTHADARAEALSALASFLIAKSSLGDTLLHVSQITTAALPAADMAGITMQGEDGRPRTAVFTDAESPEIDESQYRSGNGPCLDAWRQMRVVRIDDMGDAGDIYPEFAAAALAHGVNSTLSLPLVAGGKSVGALNLYARTPHGFSHADGELGMELATAASVVLANSSAYWAAAELAEGLQTALLTRAVIEQAKGLLMAATPELDADGAFDILRRESQRENVKLRDIAQRIVDSRRTPGGR